MMALPIVQRELRVASRRKILFIIRASIAAIGIVISAFLSFMAAMMRSGGGEMVFRSVSVYTLFIALLAGVFLASDCLSEERREGTLGFLFLTDLKGYDVVLGKFAAVSLNAFYGLLAIFPVMALPLLWGGVTGAEFWRTCLALVNCLFFSVAAAMWMSALCKSAYRAVSTAICVIVVVISIGAVASALSSNAAKFGEVCFYISTLSPMTSFARASDARYFHQGSDYWTSLAISNGAGWLFLGLASWRLNLIAEKAEPKSGWRRILSPEWFRGKPSRRRELLEVNPVLWLLEDSRRARVIAWSLAIIGGGALLIVSASAPLAMMANTYLAWPFYFLMKVFFAIQACRFFAEARRTGALELLCCTPISMRSMIQGQWAALRGIFFWPATVLMLCQLGCLCFLGASVVKGGMPVGLVGFYIPLMVLKQIANSVADFFAIGYFGMWLALTLQKPANAAGLTILYVVVLPAILMCVPTLAIDAVFIVVGVSKLQSKNLRAPC
jgi:ABC-type transport system involved in multi-copper enzyme maturation permease subunit